MDLWVREARLFQYGSGTGTNFSKVRADGEPLSGGGKSSGLMSFLKIGDRAAGAIKSGGTTRRAAKMVVVDIRLCRLCLVAMVLDGLLCVFNSYVFRNVV